MEPLLPQSSHIRINRLAYSFRSPARGDVIVFHSPDTFHRLETKRIIGLPGEEVLWAQGRISVNGAWLEEPYARIPQAPPGDEDQQTFRLGCDEYLVAGDNRLYSRDSRAYGPVTCAAILGNIC